MKHVRRVILTCAAAALLATAATPLQADETAQPAGTLQPQDSVQMAEAQKNQKTTTAPAKTTRPNRLAEFRITARDGEITPGTLQLRKGDRVRLTFVSKDSTYGVKIKQFGVSEKVKPGNPVTVEFVASEAGEFDMRCSKYWGFKHWSTNGKIVVR
jgi:cytochrome c oxidase subunit 2